MYYYNIDGALGASFDPDLDLEDADAGIPDIYLGRWSTKNRRVRFCVGDIRQIFDDREDVRWLDPSRLCDISGRDVPQELVSAVESGKLSAVNIAHPKWREALKFNPANGGRKRVHILAIGDVGGMMLTALKLMGGDVISSIGICDINEKMTERWAVEMGQVSWPWDYDSLPDVDIIDDESLFDCDVFMFAAAKSVPAVGSGTADVRMAQFEANRPLAESFARKARERGFRGLFVVVSDPVDPLCRAAWLASNIGSDGGYDALGLMPEQVQGFGLGVMNARAAYFAKRDERFSSFLTEGRSFGPHGRGLVIANSTASYDDAVSAELTELVIGANMHVRGLGFKPYIAPAISSGAMQLILTLDGGTQSSVSGGTQSPASGGWHCGSVCLGGIWFGVKNRYTEHGQSIETLTLPDVLFERLRDSERGLRGIAGLNDGQ